MTDRKRLLRTDPSAETVTTADTAVSHSPAPFRTPIPLAAPVARTTAEPADPLGGTQAAPDITSVLHRRRGQGRALPPDAAQRFGEAYGTDLSGVRVHADSESDQIARSVQATAFTHGTDVYFSAGSYAPTSSSGDRLLAHELAHVAQHQKGEFGPSGGGTTIGRANDPAEAAADTMAAGALGPIRREMATRPRASAVSGDEALDWMGEQGTRSRASAVSGDEVLEWMDEQGTRSRQGPREEALDSLDDYANPAWKDPETLNVASKAVQVLGKGAGEEDRYKGAPTGKFSAEPSASKRGRVAAKAVKEEKQRAETNAKKQPGSKLEARKIHHATDDLGEIYAHSAMLKAEYEHQVEQAAATTGGKATFRPGEGMKSLDRGLEKIVTEYGGDASRLVDVTGGSIAYDAPDDLIRGFNHLEKIAKADKIFNIVRVKNSLANGSGYGDINLSIEMGGGEIDVEGADGRKTTKHHAGFVIELQLHLTPILDVKEDGHKQYEQLRELDAKYQKMHIKDKGQWEPADRDRYKAIDTEMKALYDQNGWPKLITWREYANPRLTDKLDPLRAKLKKAIPER